MLETKRLLTAYICHSGTPIVLVNNAKGLYLQQHQIILETKIQYMINLTLDTTERVH